MHNNPDSKGKNSSLRLALRSWHLQGSVCWGTKNLLGMQGIGAEGALSVFPSAPQHPTQPSAAFPDPRWKVESCPAVPVLCPCRKDQNVLSPVNCWNLLLNQVKRESRDHTTLSDIYLNNIIPRFVQVSEDSGRLFKKVTPAQSFPLLLLKHHSGSYLCWIHLLGDFFSPLGLGFFQAFSPIWPVEICC